MNTTVYKNKRPLNRAQMLRRCAVLLLTIIMCKKSIVSANIPSSWAKESVDMAHALSITLNTQSKDYREAVIRAELAHTASNLYRLISDTNMSLDESDMLNITSTYTDIYTDGIFARPEIAHAIKYGIMYGTSGTTFSPNDPVTREQTAAVLYRIAENSGIINISNRADISRFSDANQISPYAYESFQVMVGEGILSGKSSSHLEPQGDCTYEELLTIAVRFWMLANEVQNNVIIIPSKSVYDKDKESEYDDLYKDRYVTTFYEITDEDEKTAYDIYNVPSEGYMSNEEAMQDMKEVMARVWRLGSDGTKTPAMISFLIHKDVADDVASIFDDIFNGEEKFPINSIIGYNFRGAGSKSAHNYGLAIDINPNENCFMDIEGYVLVGSHWKPYEDPFSIIPDGDVVKAFEKRGWFWGGVGWSTTGYDYMHFSANGL